MQQDELVEDLGSIAAERWRYRGVRQAAERELSELRPPTRVERMAKLFKGSHMAVAMEPKMQASVGEERLGKNLEDETPATAFNLSRGGTDQ